MFIPFEVKENNSNNPEHWGLIYINIDEQVVWYVNPTKRYDNNLNSDAVGHLFIGIIQRILTPFLRYLFVDIDVTVWKFDLFPTMKADQTIYPPRCSHNDSGVSVLLIIYLLSEDIPPYFIENDLLPFNKNIILWAKKGRIPYNSE